MKSQRKAPFLYGSIPHSVLRRAREIKNPTASSILLYLAGRTFAFRKGYIDLTYRKIADEVDVCWRSVATAARRLQEWGDLIRERRPDGSYRWWLTLDAKEIVEDPDHSFAVRQTPVLPDPHARSIMGGHDRSIMGGMQDRSWGPADGEPALKSAPARVSEPLSLLENAPLKKVFKETDLKKQHHAPGPAPQGHSLRSAGGKLGEDLEPKMAVRSTDESSHKFLIKSMIDLGISRRKARQLCREHDHDLIRRVLKTAPNRPQIKNLPAYIVTEIEDGGYEPPRDQTKKSPGEYSHPGNYAHLTDSKLSGQRQRIVKPVSDAPKSSPSAAQTRAEQRRLDQDRQRREADYEQDLRELLNRYKLLPDEQRNGLHDAAQRYLETMLPNVSRRSTMATDPTFKRVAIKSVLERFFRLVDEGLSGLQALSSPQMLCYR